ncbi:hypothetical protein [Nitrosomonas sp.]|uniref:hypothetical protein n=1 Tax=Nitrosomonas sp. TaxID=42353 RepID=UPI00374CAA78
MATRGRKSSASLTVAKFDIGAAKRLEAPLHLSDAEMAVWSEIVNDQPATSFTTTHAPMLEMYCRHVVNNRIIADELVNFNRASLADDEGLKRYDTLLRIAERESRAASSLATRLRITRQAVDHPATAGRAIANHSTGRKPWDTENRFANNIRRSSSESDSI